jgi:hypothetical protein
MTQAIANVNTSTDSFGQWITKTNQALFAISYNTLTSGNTMYGNSSMSGTFSANNLIVNNTISLGKSSANLIANGEYVLLRSSSTSNTIYTANGMIVDGVVQYKSNIMQMGQSVIRSSNVSSYEGHFTNLLKVGNSVITTNRATFDNLNVKFGMWMTANLSVGFTEANTLITRNGIEIFDNATGSYQTNSKMTSTTLWIDRIYTNTIFAQTINTSGNLSISAISSNVIFYGNTTFEGQNNHFKYGLSSNVYILVGPNFKSPQATKTALLSVKESTVAGAPVLNTLSLVTIEGATPALEFRSSSKSGIMFVDNEQAGYVQYTTSDDTLNLGAKTRIKFDLGSQSSTSDFAAKTQAALLDSTGFTVKGALKLNGSSSGTVTIVPQAAAGSPTFTLPNNTGSSDQVLKTDGSGNLSWGTVQSVPPPTTDLEVNSLGVGTPASGVTGEIRATSDITAFYSSDRRLKTNIRPVSNSIEKLQALNGVYFDWTDEQIEKRGGEDGYFVRKNDVGVIAQEVEEILPEAVATREDGIKAVNYEKLIPVLIEAIKELNKEVEELKWQLKQT